MQFQVSLQLFKNCCQSNPTLARTKETSHYLIVFVISVAIWGNIYGVVRMLQLLYNKYNDCWILGVKLHLPFQNK